MTYTLDATKRERIVALDLLRGYFLTIIVVDHLMFFPSVFELISGRGQLWTSAAEGFFIISGILVGYVYGPRMQQNAGRALKKIAQRVAKLYVWAVLLTWLFVWWAHQVDVTRVKEGLWQSPPIGEFLYKTLTLQYSYGWANFLQYYVLFLAVAPLALWLCVRRRAWIVVAGSVLVWILRGNNFNMAWQLLFMCGVVGGYYLPQLEQTVRGWPAAIQRRSRRALYGTALGLLSLSVLAVEFSTNYMIKFDPYDPSFPAAWNALMRGLSHLQIVTQPWADKWTLAPLRLATAIVVFVALYVFMRAHEQVINRFTRGFLQTFGQNSLFVYGLHAVVIFSVLLVFPRSVGFALNTVYTAFVLAGTYVITRYYQQLMQGSKQAFRRAVRVIRQPIFGDNV